jgi:hypothetical protein
MATGGATTGTGDPAIFGEKPILHLEVMDETEPVDCQLSCGQEIAAEPAAAQMDVSTDRTGTGPSDILANSMLPVDKEREGMLTNVSERRMWWSDFVVAIDSEVGRTSDPSALSGFIAALRSAGGLPVEETVDEMAAGAASNDIGTVGCLLGMRDVNAITFSESELPESVVRRPLKCSLLDVAVGSGSVEMTKYLLEFHGARPTRETLKQSISSGNLELFKMMRERLPEAEFRFGDDLMEVAAEFHQGEVLEWSFTRRDDFRARASGCTLVGAEACGFVGVRNRERFRPLVVPDARGVVEVAGECRVGVCSRSGGFLG